MAAVRCEKREGAVGLGGGWPKARDSDGDGALLAHPWQTKRERERMKQRERERW
jgi:hypothetical protein